MNAPSIDAHGQATDALNLSPQQADAIVRVVEAAPAVRRRHQYFVWTQNQLQTLLPHQILACGAYVRQRRDLVFEVFHSIVLPPELLAMLTDTQGPLLRTLRTAWIEARAQPLMLLPGRLTGTGLGAAVEALNDCDVQNLLVHGVARPQRPTELESFFVFASAGRMPPGPTLAHAELLVPYLHWSWQRVLAAERELALPTPAVRAAQRETTGRDGKRVSERERQVLLWVSEGKSNQQIGEALGISPLTVKNHVQRILRKLDCSNRAQAVAEALSRGLLPGSAPR